MAGFIILAVLVLFEILSFVRKAHKRPKVVYV
jgi:hypothetical protein